MARHINQHAVDKIGFSKDAASQGYKAFTGTTGPRRVRLDRKSNDLALLRDTCDHYGGRGTSGMGCIKKKKRETDLEAFVLEDLLDGDVANGIAIRADESGLKDDAEAAVAHDFAACVLNFFLLACLAV